MTHYIGAWTTFVGRNTPARTDNQSPHWQPSCASATATATSDSRTAVRAANPPQLSTSQSIAAKKTFLHLRAIIIYQPRYVRPAAYSWIGTLVECSMTTTSHRTCTLVPASISPNRMAVDRRATPSSLGISSCSWSAHFDSRFACAKALTQVFFLQNRTSNSFGQRNSLERVCGDSGL